MLKKLTLLSLLILGCKDYSGDIRHLRNQNHLNKAFSTANNQKIQILTEKFETLKLYIATMETEFSSEINKINVEIQYIMELISLGYLELQDQLSEHLEYLNDLQANQYLMQIQYDLDMLNLEAKLYELSYKISQLNQLVDSEIADLLTYLQALEASYQTQIEEINTTFSTITQNLLIQIQALQNDSFKIIKPCTNAKEVLIETPNGLLAYFQTGYLNSVTFEAHTTVPEHLVCLDPQPIGDTGKLKCNSFDVITSVITTHSKTISFFVLENAYLAILSDGHYRTTDGTGCTFRIQNGEIF
jgi:hypothetical protein